MSINMSSPTDEVLESIATGKNDDPKLVSVFKPSTDTAEFAERTDVDIFGEP
jgi:NitT/TauT family transport system substrate-binding protein